MASVQTASYDGRYLKLTVVEESTSIENNSSTLRWTLESIGGVQAWYTIYNWGVTIGDQVIYPIQTTGYSTGKFPASKGSRTGTVNIIHNADGTAPDVSFTLNGKVFKSGTASFTGSIPLTTIPRASIPSITPNTFNIGDTLTINTNRKSTQFTHTVTLYFGNYSYQIATGVGDAVIFNTSTIASYMYQQIPTASEGVGNITLETYNGSTYIGTEYSTFIAKVTNSSPTFDTAYLDTNATTTAITGNNQQIIRNNSTLQVNITNALAKNYATLNSAKVTINGTDYTAVFSGGNATFNIGTLNISSNTTAVVTVTDSRGISTTKNLSLIVLDWELPTAIITLQRENNFYSETDINVNAEYSSLDNKNTISIKVRYKKVSDASYGAYTDLQDDVTSQLTLDNNYQWNVQVLLQDKLGSTTYNLLLSRGMPIVFFDRLKSSTGFNCFPQNDQSVEIDGKTVIDMIYPVGSIYLSVNNTDPSTLFGGTWEQIKDQFLLSAGDTYAGGSTGGSSTHKHVLPIGFDNTSLYGYGDSNYFPAFGSGVRSNVNRIATPINDDTGAVRIGSTDAGDSMPPYLAVYVWKRTA